MKKEIKAGAVLGYVNIIAKVLVALIYTPLMLKLMGQSEYGLYSLVASVITYLSVLDMGFGNAMIRFISRSQAKKDNKEDRINGMFLLLYTIVGIIAFIIGLIIALNVDVLFENSLTIQELEKAKILMIVLTLNVSLSFPLSVFDSYVIANEKYIYAKVLTLIKTLITPIAMIPLLLMGYKSITMTIVTSFFNLLSHVSMFIFCIKKLNMKISFKVKQYDKTLFKEIMFYSFFVFLTLIVDNVFRNSDQIILGSVSGTIAVSVYAVASQISNINTQFSTTISGLFLSRTTKMLEEKNADENISNMFIKVSRIQIYIMTLILSGFIIFGKSFITLWAGEEYIDAYYIVILLIAPAIVPLTQNLGISILQARNKHQFRSLVYIFLAVGNIAVSIPLAKLYGGIGAALGSAIVTFLGQILTMNIYYQKVAKLDIKKYWKFFIKFILQVAAIASICMYFIRNIEFTFIGLMFGIIVYGIIYLFIVYFNMNVEEKSYFINIVKKLIS